MTTPYFNAAAPEDTRLLPTSIRTASELIDVAEAAERDVISEYTLCMPDPTWTGRNNVRTAVQVGDNTWVFLLGYAIDAAEASTDLREAMRQTIAGVVRWRLAQWKAEPLVSAQSDGTGASKTMREDAQDPFPPSWDRQLVPYDRREPAWGW